MSNNKQQTAVEYLVEQLFPKALSVEQYYHIEKAKEMEREQKRKDFVDGYTHGDFPLNHSVIDKWYEKTYGGVEQ